MRTAILHIDDLAVGYTTRAVLSGVQLSVQPGECVWVHGVNGSGKSTLLKALAGTLTIWGGRVEFDGMRIDTLPQARRFELGMGYLPQRDNVFPSLSTRDFWAIVHRSNGKAFSRRCDELLQQMAPLQADFDVPLSRLSGGQRQLAALGAVLVRPRRLLLLDEPAAGLATEVSAIVYGIIRALVRDGMTCLLVEHDADLATSVCSRRLSLASEHAVYGTTG